MSCNTSECTARFMTFHRKQRPWISGMLQHNLTVWPTNTQVVSQQNVGVNLALAKRALTFVCLSVMCVCVRVCVSPYRLNPVMPGGSTSGWSTQTIISSTWGTSGSRWTCGIFFPKDFSLNGGKSPTAHVNAISHHFSGGERLRAWGCTLRILMPLVTRNRNRPSNGSSQSALHLEPGQRVRLPHIEIKNIMTIPERSCCSWMHLHSAVVWS